jgi:ferredoxin-NADP reductase/uncharacterized protein YcbX
MATDGTLASITRYPLKGLPGVSTDSATIVAGEGLAHDRVLAIETGDHEPRAGGGWRPRAVFHHLAKNPELVRFSTRLDPAPEHGERAMRLTVGNPEGETTSILLPSADHGDEAPAPHLEAANSVIGDWFAPGARGGAAVTAPAVRIWDWPEALISLINLESLADLAAQTGRTIDPRRFRANLLVSGLPAWSEFSLVGRVVTLGDVAFEVFQPTDRCRATTVDPATGLVDLNVPAVLAARLGHMFCGVYLRPITGGTITTGATLRLRDEAARVAVVPDPSWPRPATVTARSTETSLASSFWIDDPAGLLPRAIAGQHVRVHLPQLGAPNWRNYTISGVDRDRVRITVKRSADVSVHLHENLRPGDRMLVSGPFGRVQFDPLDQTPVLLLSAGIGITPTLAALRALQLAGSRIPVEVLHVERSTGEVAHLDELLALVAALPSATLTLNLTRPDAPAATSPNLDDAVAAGRVRLRPGRPRDEQISASVARASGSSAGTSAGELRALVCGPAVFLEQAVDALEGAGMARSRIHFDVFYTPTLPDPEPEPKSPPEPGPFTVSFPATGDSAVWTAESGSLLDLAEAAGQDWPSACRSGACGTCENVLRSGTIAYLTEPVIQPSDGRILTCCAVPTGDVVVGEAVSEPTPQGAIA